MAPALCRLATYPAADFIATTEDARTASQIVRWGTPAQHLPPFCSSDLIYAAGSPKVVDAVSDAAIRAGATFFADPFLPSGQPEANWFSRQVAKVSLSDLKLRLNTLFQGMGKPMNGETNHLLDGIGHIETHEEPAGREGFIWRNVA
jgi:hypothetical protein